jgi:hypothetical protein
MRIRITSMVAAFATLTLAATGGVAMGDSPAPAPSAVPQTPVVNPDDQSVTVTMRATRAARPGGRRRMPPPRARRASTAS